MCVSENGISKYLADQELQLTAQSNLCIWEYIFARVTNKVLNTASCCTVGPAKAIAAIAGLS